MIMSKKTLKNNNTSTPTATSHADDPMSEEINDNEEVLFELDECLHNKAATVDELKEQVRNVENDISKYTKPYNAQKSTLESDINMFRSIASKYVSKELIDFYVDRMRKSADNALNAQESTISALCQTISKNDSKKK